MRVPNILGPLGLCSVEKLSASLARYRLVYPATPSNSRWEEIVQLTETAGGWRWMVDGYSTWGLQDTAEEAVSLAIEFVEAAHNLPSGVFTLA